MGLAERSILEGLTRFAGRLRFPQLFALSAALLLLDLLIPDLIPFADEILLALVTLLLGILKRRREPPESPEEGPVIDVPADPVD